MGHECNRAAGFGLLSGLQVEPCPEGRTPDPREIRADVEAAISKLERGDAGPVFVRFWRVVLPQTTRWLPAPDRDAFLARWDAASAPSS